jgi:hypothetical protein
VGVVAACQLALVLCLHVRQRPLFSYDASARGSTCHCHPAVLADGSTLAHVPQASHFLLFGILDRKLVSFLGCATITPTQYDDAPQYKWQNNCGASA